MNSIALLVSSVFEPMLVLPLMILFGGWHAGLRGGSFITLVIYVLLFSGFVWMLRIVAVKKLKTNWDMSDRKKRIRALLPLVSFSVVFFSVLFLWRDPALISFSLSVFIWMIGFFLITLRTKISGHLSVITLTLGFLLRWYGPSYWPLLLILPLVAWSRMVLKRHNPVEVIGGFLYSVSLLLFLW